MEKKRITYFDLAKGIGIILVVLGHMENISTELRIWISSFHMPLFFIVSGMLIAAKNEIDLSFENSVSIATLVKKKAKGILLPYLWFSLIYIPVDIINLFVLDNVDSHTFIQNILDSVTFSGISVMWFLPALFIAETVALWIIGRCGFTISNKLLVKAMSDDKSKKAFGYFVLVILALIISIISFKAWDIIRPVYDANSGNYLICSLLGIIRVLLRGACMSFHVITGFMVYKVIALLDNSTKISAGIKGYSIAAGVICFVLNLSLCLKNDAVDNHFLTLNSLPLYYLCAFLGSMAIILICKGLDSIKFIEFLGKNSLIIMATHLQLYILYAGIRIALIINEYVTRAKSYIYMFNAVFFTMLIEAVVIVVINRFFPFIIGKKKK